MKFFGKNKALAEEIAVGGAPEHTDAEKDATRNTIPNEKNVSSSDDVNSLEKVPTADAQAGVRKVEAVTLTWTKQELYIAYGWSVLTSLVNQA